MKGFTRTGPVASLACLAMLSGCHYRSLVDTCYPERYNFIAHNTVCAFRKAQVSNGHVLDQTMWNWHFTKAAPDLNAAGKEHLLYLIRRRPHPDTVVYLATAQDMAPHDDLVYDPANPDAFAEQRSKLDQARIEAVQNYVRAQTAGRDLEFQVLVHDPAETGIPAPQAAITIATWNASAQSGITGGGGGGGGAVGQ